MDERIPEGREVTPEENREVPEGAATRYGRRAMMLGAAAAGAGITASLMGGAAPAEAANGAAVLLGSVMNDATRTTAISTTKGNGLQAATSESGQSGIVGEDKSSHGGQAVLGSSTNGVGVAAKVKGSKNANPALTAQTAGTGSAITAKITNTKNKNPAISGITSGTSEDSVGVFGGSPSGAGVAGFSPSGAGVAGESTSDEGVGVFGICASGLGVGGEATSGTGVAGLSTSGAGVSGSSTSGAGVYATSSTSDALQVDGPAAFSTCGVAKVQSGDSAVPVTLASVTPSSLILATLQSDAAGTVAVANVVPASGSFTINLTGVASSEVTVAWFAIEVLASTTKA